MTSLSSGLGDHTTTQRSREVLANFFLFFSLILEFATMSIESSTSAASNSIVAEWEQLPHHFAQVADGIQLHYVDVGPRDATPVVLLHGWPDISFAWRVSGYV